MEIVNDGKFFGNCLKNMYIRACILYTHGSYTFKRIKTKIEKLDKQSKENDNLLKVTLKNYSELELVLPRAQHIDSVTMRMNHRNMLLKPLEE